MSIYATSGTTSDPKQFHLTEDELSDRIERMLYTKGPGFAELNSIFVGLSPVCSAAKRYEFWMRGKEGGAYYRTHGHIKRDCEVILRERPECIVDLPQRLFQYAQELDGRHKFKIVLGSGSSVRPETAKFIRSKLGDDCRYGYGCSELPSIALATSEMVEELPGCLGKVWPDITYDILFNGEIRLRGPNMLSRYENPRHCDRFFKNGWFYPGDKVHEISWCGETLLVYDGRV